MSFTESSSNLSGFLVLLFFTLSITISYGTNTLSTNQSLSGDLTIISEGEKFELGFFKAGNSFNYYIGIWYKKLYSNPPIIFLAANRETPISDRFYPELKTIDGNLVLLNESKSHIWSTNVTTSIWTTESVWCTYVNFCSQIWDLSLGGIIPVKLHFVAFRTNNKP